MSGKDSQKRIIGSFCCCSRDWTVFGVRRSAALQAHPNGVPPAQFFARKITAGLADSIIYLDADGTILYPARTVRSAYDPLGARSDWQEARALEDQGQNSATSQAYEQIAKVEKNDSIVAPALQAEIQCLLRNGDKENAIRIIEREFMGERFKRVADLEGHSIGADEQLLLLNLIARQDRRYQAAAHHLHTVVADYESWALPSVQRLFLMRQIKALKLDGNYADFPTYAAESLAQSFLEGASAKYRR